MERAHHPLELIDLRAKPGRMSAHEPLDLAALTPPVAPQIEQLADLGDREAEIARPANEAQFMKVVFKIVTEVRRNLSDAS